jgi:NTP pyrophosphatase (non-canonical NTP hydrolase)
MQRYRNLLDTMTIDELAQEALNTFGIEKQMAQTQEELAELIVAINKFNRGILSPIAILQEIADVIIMIKQLQIYFVNEEVFSDILDSKLEKVKEHLEKHKNVS